MGRKPRQKHKRRRNGEGSITRRKDGRWQGAYTVEIDGFPKRMFFYGLDEQEVVDKLALIHAEKIKGTFIKPQDRTVGYYIDEWLNAKKKSVVNNTWVKYDNFSQRFEPIREIKIQELTRKDVQDFINNQDLKPASVAHLKMILSAAVNLAIDDKVIINNVCRSVQLPRIKEKPIRILTMDEMKKILMACANSYVYDVVCLEYATGLRRGEILGLTWDDVDFDNNTISVNKSWIIISGKPQWSEAGTKTEEGRRVVAILPETAEWLKRLKARKNTIYLFESASGLPVNPQNFFKQFKKLVRDAGMEISFHDLRHNYATNLMMNNIHTSLIQGQLGQRDTKTTKRYMHAVLSARKKAVESLRGNIPLM